MHITWLNFGGILLETVFFSKWPWPWVPQDQISNQLYLRHCWSDWCEMKRELINRILGRLYDFDHTHDIGLGVSWSEFEKFSKWPWPWVPQDQISNQLYLRHCWSDWCEMKRELINRILGRLYDFDHTHDIGLGVSWSEFEIALSQEWEDDWHGTKRMWVIYLWSWYWLMWPLLGGRMYRIVTGVTSDVGLPSTLVVYWNHL